MPDIYSIRYFKNKPPLNNKIVVCIWLGLLFFFFPEYPKRLVYPLLFGQKASEKLTISKDGNYEDVTNPPIDFVKNDVTYTLYPKTKYSITAKIGYIDHYDTIFNKIYRGYSQNNYINLVPMDLLMVNGNMAKPEIYKLFEFEHEERLGRVICKGVKYRHSFFSAYFSSEEEFQKSEDNYKKCHPNINENEYNNYHPIPANENINKGLHTMLAGDVVYIEGYLTDVKMGKYLLPTGTRTNQYHNYLINGQNPGMCFILYTTKLIVNGYAYQ